MDHVPVDGTKALTANGAESQDACTRAAAAPADTDRRVFVRVGSRVFRRFDFGLLLGCA